MGDRVVDLNGNCVCKNCKQLFRWKTAIPLGGIKKGYGFWGKSTEISIIPTEINNDEYSYSVICPKCKQINDLFISKEKELHEIENIDPKAP